MAGNQSESPGFLDLPRRARLLIYLHAGMLWRRSQPWFIDLNSKGAPDSNHGRNYFLTTYRLLLTCHKIRKDLSPVVYGINCFFIRYADSGDLAALRRLNPKCIQALRHLTIHLNVASCGLGRPCSGYLLRQNEDYDKIDNPLTLSESHYSAVTSEWHRTWKDHVQPNLVQGRLQLSFVCDVEELEVGQLIARPFLDMEKPLLRKCSIRLCHKRDAGLQKLCEQVVTASTVPSSSAQQPNIGNEFSRFPFLQLAAEIRHQIFGYTDLVTPFREVEWNPKHGYYSRYQLPESRGDGRRDYSDGVHGRTFPSKAERMLWANMDEAASEFDRYFACWEFTEPHGCYCRASHAAFSNIEPCKCWAAPTALFLINKAFKQDALQVFLGSNRIVIAPEGGRPWQGVESSPPRLPISIYLSDIVPEDALQFLRKIEIVFPALGEKILFTSYCLSRSAEWEDWVQTLDAVRARLDLRKLTITTHFASWRATSAPIIPRWRYEMLPSEAEDFKACYTRVLTPIMRLQGLRRFFVYLPYPGSWKSPFPPEGVSAGTGRLESLEEAIERSVMGPEYDADLAENKHLERCRWMEDAYNYDFPGYWYE